MGRYKVLEAIGEGSFGKVFRGECRDTQRIVALKFIPKHLKGDSELSSLRRECEIQRGLFHPNIVLMLDSFETEREVVAVSEYVPQQLCALLQTNGTMSETMVRAIACNLVSALYYLHSHRIVHRDIKPQNILLTESGVAKLCDFGFSKKMEINTYVLESIKGTPLYMAPELIEQQPYDQKADLWSLGCILFELLTGTPPFCTNSIVHLIEMVRTKPVQWPSGCSRNCIDFLQGLLQKDQDKRLEWPDVLQHTWVSSGITVVPHNPMIATLTSPLTQSQQQVKEHQKQQLVKRNMGHPNLLPKALSRKFFSEAQVVPELEAMKLDTRDDTAPSPAHPCPHRGSVSAEKISSSLNVHSKLRSVDLPQDNSDAKQTLTWFPHLHQNSAVPAAQRMNEVRGDDHSDEAQQREQDFAVPEDVCSHDTRKSSCTSRRDSKISSDQLDDRTENRSNSQIITQSMKKTETLGVAIGESEIQEDEWIHFLNQSIADIMGGNFDVYTQPGELALFVSPLRNSTCPFSVAEKIAVFFMLPFVLKPGENLLSEICQSLLQHKVVCNLIFACKQIKKESSEKNELDKAQVDAMNQMLLVICHLVHLDPPLGTQFLNQLCEAICVLECHAILGQTLLSSAASSQLLASILAILTQILRSEDAPPGVELDGVVRAVVATASVAGVDAANEDKPEETALRFLLMSLLTHTASLVRSRCSTLLAYLTARCSVLVSSALTGQHKVLCDLINLENDSSREVCRAASFALTRLQQHTSLLKQPA